MKYLAIFCILVLCGSEISALQKCPKLKFMKNFNRAKFLGKWNVIQTSGLETLCANFEVSELLRPNSYRITLQPVNINIELTQRQPKDISDGFVEKSPLALVNNANLFVIDTDYDNYAAIVECKDTDNLFYMSVTLGSRSKYLSEDVINKMKKSLAEVGVDYSGLKVISHKDCF